MYGQTFKRLLYFSLLAYYCASHTKGFRAEQNFDVKDFKLEKYINATAVIYEVGDDRHYHRFTLGLGVILNKQWILTRGWNYFHENALSNIRILVDPQANRSYDHNDFYQGYFSDNNDKLETVPTERTVLVEQVFIHRKHFSDKPVERCDGFICNVGDGQFSLTLLKLKHALPEGSFPQVKIPSKYIYDESRVGILTHASDSSYLMMYNAEIKPFKWCNMYARKKEVTLMINGHERKSSLITLSGPNGISFKRQVCAKWENRTVEDECNVSHGPALLFALRGEYELNLLGVESFRDTTGCISPQWFVRLSSFSWEIKNLIERGIEGPFKRVDSYNRNNRLKHYPVIGG